MLQYYTKTRAVNRYVGTILQSGNFWIDRRCELSPVPPQDLWKLMLDAIEIGQQPGLPKLREVLQQVTFLSQPRYVQKVLQNVAVTVDNI